MHPDVPSKLHWHWPDSLSVVIFSFKSCSLFIYLFRILTQMWWQWSKISPVSGSITNPAIIPFRCKSCAKTHFRCKFAKVVVVSAGIHKMAYKSSCTFRYTFFVNQLCSSPTKLFAAWSASAPDKKSPSHCVLLQLWIHTRNCCKLEKIRWCFLINFLYHKFIGLSHFRGWYIHLLFFGNLNF